MIVIGIAGYARAGKDTFCTIAKNILTENGLRAKQYSFAGALKEEVRPFLQKVCGVDVYTQDSEIKKDIRDFLVWYGTTFWRKRDPKRWIRGVDNQIKLDGNDIDVALVSDVRYPNEGEWVHSWSGYLVHIAAWKWEDRRDGLGDSVPCKIEFDAPNEQERINDPLVKAMANYRVHWQAKGLSPTAAVEDPDLQLAVLTALNSCSWFNNPLSLSSLRQPKI